MVRFVVGFVVVLVCVVLGCVALTTGIFDGWVALVVPVDPFVTGVLAMVDTDGIVVALVVTVLVALVVSLAGSAGKNITVANNETARTIT